MLNRSMGVWCVLFIYVPAEAVAVATAAAKSATTMVVVMATTTRAAGRGCMKGRPTHTHQREMPVVVWAGDVEGAFDSDL